MLLRLMPKYLINVSQKIGKNLFRVEKGIYGRKLVMISAWNPATAEYMRQNGLKELEVNRFRDGEYGIKSDPKADLSFLKDLLFLEALNVPEPDVEDDTDVGGLVNLRVLSLTYSKNSFDFSNFKRLERCSINWRSQTKNLSGSKSLTDLSIWGYSNKSSSELGSLIALKKLGIYGGSLSELNSFQYLASLESLQLDRLKNLTSLHGIEKLPKLKKLEITHCKRIENIDILAKLPNLEFLNLSNMGDIESLKVLARLNKLRALHFYERTKILDGDLEFLLKMPKLKDARFQSRKHYTLKSV